MDETSLNQLTEQIIGLAFKVHNALGAGFMENVYENALLHELTKSGHDVHSQSPIDVHYDGILVGEFRPDIMVDDLVIIELKATRRHEDLFTAQCLNYLRATGKPVCLLLNFGDSRLDIKRYRGKDQCDFAG